MRSKLVAVTSLLAAASLVGAAPAPAAQDVQKCQQVYNFPDAGSKVCVDTEGWCLIGEYRTTFLGTEFYCYVRKP